MDKLACNHIPVSHTFALDLDFIALSEHVEHTCGVYGSSVYYAHGRGPRALSTKFVAHCFVLAESTVKCLFTYVIVTFHVLKLQLQAQVAKHFSTNYYCYRQLPVSQSAEREREREFGAKLAELPLIES